MPRHTRVRTALAALAATTALLAAGVPVAAQAATPGPAGQNTAGPGTAGPSATSPQATAARARLLADASGQAASLARSIGLGDQEQLVVKDAVADANGTRHLRYNRTYAGLPVLGGDLVVHQSAAGTTLGVDRASTANLTGLGTTPAVAAPKAQAAALATEAGASVDAAPQLVVWAVGDQPKLAWQTLIGGKQADGTPSRLQVVTDAATGAVLSRTETLETGTGTGVFVGQVPLTTTQSGSSYQLKDATRGGQYTTDMANGTSGNGTVFTKSSDTWGNGSASNRESAAVDAQYGAAATWDYYKNTFGRNGIRNDGQGAYSRVHYDSDYTNAFWDDSCFCMTYGDGSGNTHPLTEIDVSGHEMSHGVTAATAGLDYSGESGGLNEATSDIMGTGVEWYANLAVNPPNYDLGELINLNGDGTPLRYMDKPSKDGNSADFWSSSVGNLDVHYSSGVANHLFYLLAEGSTPKTINGFSYNSPTENGISVTGVGRDKALHIWYQALTAHMTSTTNYAAARTATLAAATDLYGANSAEYNQVATAWAAVNVGSLPTGGVTVTSPGNQSTAVGTAVSLQVATSGGTAPLSYAATGLPAGLSINSGSGLITGTPTTAGTSNVTVTVTDSAGKSGSASFTWTVGGGGGGCAGAGTQLLGNAGFETGTASPWTASSGVVDNSSSEPAHAGSWKAWLDGYGSTHTDTLSQSVTIPAGCKATLSFWLHVDTAETGTTAYDKLAVTANGTSLASYSNVNANTGYAQKSFDLSSYAGSSVTVKFSGVEDSSLQTSFVIDDTALTTG
ncbi:M4 family metallopeptidase [Kitasatospora sp. NBC_01287]|uniref:M4 family metallopeptidase n=1 Tax=Kitasatospora sp. NBC_01287 TaxID=2903573 RepID=UPI00224D2295|nr:M4 family metallopeptidase [Kitasatospora sp. NBC_01287]MCX4751091.1 M4 family metallopeptidase [Kitasatospora sp. NBC_01287]